MSRNAVISFADEATEPAEQFFVMLIGWHMTVTPEPNIDLLPFNGELVSVGVAEDGHLKGVWRRTDPDGTLLPDEEPVMLDLYDELDRVEVL